MKTTICSSCNVVITSVTRTLCRNCYQKQYRKNLSTFAETNRINSQKYYEKHKMAIKIKREEKKDEVYKDRRGHVRMVYRSVRHYAMRHKPKAIPIETQLKFVHASYNDPRYNKLYERWVRKGFDISYSPMITRMVYGGPYYMSNIKWVTKADVGLDDIEAQKDLVEHRSTVVEEIVGASRRYGHSNRDELKSWLKRMPGLYKHTTLDEIIKEIEAVFKRDNYAKYKFK